MCVSFCLLVAEWGVVICVRGILFSLKKTEQDEQMYCIKFCNRLAILKAKQLITIIRCRKVHQCFTSMLHSSIAPDSDFLARHGIPVVLQPPYFPDMAPSDFWKFSNWRRHSKYPILKVEIKYTEHEDGVEHNSKRSLQEVFSAVAGTVG